MALQSTASASNPLCLSEIKTEFNSISSNCLTGFYGAASGVPSSGNICVSDFLGKSSIFQATALSFDSSAAMTAVATGIHPEVYITDHTTLPSKTAINLATELTNQGWDGSTPVNASITINEINTAHTSNDWSNGVWTWKYDGSLVNAFYGGWMTTSDYNNNNSVATAWSGSGNSGTRYDIPKDRCIGLTRSNFVSGAIPSGSTITINVNGFLQGTAGAGGTLGTIGTTSATDGTDGAKGGPIFDLSAADYDVTWNFTQGTNAKIFKGLGGAGGACGFTWSQYPSYFHTNNSYSAVGASDIAVYNVTKNRFAEALNIAPFHNEGNYGTSHSLYPLPSSGYYRSGSNTNGRYSGVPGAYVMYSTFAGTNYGGATATGTQYIKCRSTDGQDGYGGSYLTGKNMVFNWSGGHGGPDGNIFKYKNSLGATIESDTAPYNWSGTVSVIA